MKNKFKALSEKELELIKGGHPKKGYSKKVWYDTDDSEESPILFD